MKLISAHGIQTEQDSLRLNNNKIPRAYLKVLHWLLFCSALARIVFMGCSRYDAHDALGKGDINALQAALEHGVNADQMNEEGLSLLHVAVAKQDVAATRILIEHGAKWNIPDRAGQTPLVTALLGGLGPDPLKAMLGKEAKNQDDPSVRVLRVLMSAVRKESSSEVDMKGKLNINLQMAGMDNKGVHLVPHITFEVPGRKTYEINLSRWETDYLGVEKSGNSSGWEIVLRPGGHYRIAGAEKDGKIDATLLSLEAPSKDGGAMAMPLQNWLPSTWKLMEEHTWLGKFSGK